MSIPFRTDIKYSLNSHLPILSIPSASGVSLHSCTRGRVTNLEFVLQHKWVLIFYSCREGKHIGQERERKKKDRRDGEKKGHRNSEL